MLSSAPETQNLPLPALGPSRIGPSMSGWLVSPRALSPEPGVPRCLRAGVDSVPRIPRGPATDDGGIHHRRIPPNPRGDEFLARLGGRLDRRPAAAGAPGSGDRDPDVLVEAPLFSEGPFTMKHPEKFSEGADSTASCSGASPSA